MGQLISRTHHPDTLLRPGIERGKGPARLIAEGANMVDSILLKNYVPVTLAPKILWDAKGFEFELGGFSSFRCCRVFEISVYQGFRVSGAAGLGDTGFGCGDAGSRGGGGWPGWRQSLEDAIIYNSMRKMI